MAVDARTDGQRLLPVRGAWLCAETFGDDNDPAILLVGGQNAALDWWDDALCARLADGRWVIRYDHRDTGRSTSSPPGAPDYTAADLVDDALGVLDALGLDDAHVVGMSMGGAIAQRLAVTAPQRVLSLTLVATSGALPGLRDDLPGVSAELEEFLAADPGGEQPSDNVDAATVVDGLVARQRALAGASFDESRVRALAERVVARTANLASLGNHVHLEGGPATEGTLADIAAPTLVVHGTADPLFPLPHGEELAAVIGDAELLALPGVGHEVPPPSTWDVVVPALLWHTAG